MLTFHILAKLIRDRRKELGLTQARLAKLAGLSRLTVNQLESGTLPDLSFLRLTNLLYILGLSMDAPSLTARSRKKGLWMAAKTSSVSYRREMTSKELENALTSGAVLPEVEANLLHFLDEASLPVVVMAVEEAAQHTSIDPQKIWANVRALAINLGSARSEIWV